MLAAALRGACPLYAVQARALADWVQVHGAHGSPYTRKVQAALRYKRVPFTSHSLMPGDINQDWAERGFGEIKPKVIPVVVWPDQTVQNDSTFVLLEAERRFPSRPVTPTDPLTAFLALLLEDLFDEWGTKVMFGMRWQQRRDQTWSGAWLCLDTNLGNGQPAPQLAAMGSVFGARQVERMGVVGCNDPALVLRSLHCLAGALERHLATGSLCLLGSTPTQADFALYGQLSQLVIDRTPDELLRTEYPGVWAWVRRFEDLSGLEEAHSDNTTFLQEILSFAGQVYLPFLAANSAAIEAGLKEVTVELWEEDPIQHTQPIFRYQQKCFQRILASHAGLPPLYRKRAAQLMDGTGCNRFFH